MYTDEYKMMKVHVPALRDLPVGSKTRRNLSQSALAEEAVSCHTERHAALLCSPATAPLWTHSRRPMYCAADSSSAGSDDSSNLISPCILTICMYFILKYFVRSHPYSFYKNDMGVTRDSVVVGEQNSYIHATEAQKL